MRGMAENAVRVSRCSVQGRKRLRLMTAHARWWGGDSLRAVRAMAGLATGLDVGVQHLALALVTASAGGGFWQSSTGVRLVARRALLVSRGGGHRLLGVARGAGRGRRGSMSRAPVARATVRVTAILRNQRALGGMTTGAKRKPRSRSWKRVRNMAVGTQKPLAVRVIVGRSHLRVAGRASVGLGGRVLTMGNMAADARVLTSMIHVNLRMAVLARSGGRVWRVRHVAARALRVRRGRCRHQ